MTTFEGLKVDWPVIVANSPNSLHAGMTSVMDGKKAWGGLAQWLTMLLPLDAHDQAEEVGLVGDHV